MLSAVVVAMQVVINLVDMAEKHTMHIEAHHQSSPRLSSILMSVIIILYHWITDPGDRQRNESTISAIQSSSFLILATTTDRSCTVRVKGVLPGSLYVS